ncbi:MAG: insulinase family protein [Spirochaetia bacterium]|nr:insulinase family protein [Spirochaetia bacterium]
MKKLILLLAISSLVALQAQAPPRQAHLSSATTEHAQKILAGIPMEPVRFQPPTIKEIKLKSGATLLVTDENSLPFLTLELHFPGGTKLESIEHAGLWDAATSLLAVDGAGNLTGDQIAEEFSRMGARFSIRNDYESWVVTLTVLKWHFPRAFQLLSDVLLRPQLSQDRLNVILDGMETDIAQRNNRPESTAGRRLQELLYPGSRRGKSLEKSDLQKITTAGIKSEIARRLYAGNMIVAAGGDLRGINLESSLDGLLSQFPATAIPKETERLNPRKYTDKILLVEMDVAQAAVTIGTILPAHRSPDFYALQIGNHVLGGNSFNSRLMKEVRAKRGLAYYAMSYTSFFEDDGRFISAAGTRVEQADETLKLMLSIIHGMNKPAGEQESGLAKDSILNSLVFLYDDPESYLRSQVRFRLHGLPVNYIQEYQKHIQSESTTAVAKAFAKYVKSDVNIVVAGPKSLKAQLEKIRPVIVVGPESRIP